MLLSPSLQVDKERFFGTEAVFEDLLAAMAVEIHSEIVHPQRTKDTFERLERSLVKLSNEIAVLRQIVNFSKILTASSDPKEVLDQFNNCIAASIPVNRVGILVVANQMVLYQSTIVLDSTDGDELVQEILTKKCFSAPDPFESRTEFYKRHEKALLISNRNLRLDEEEYEKYLAFVTIEPIMAMASETRFHTVFDSRPLDAPVHTVVHNQRLEEEMEKR